MTEFNSRLSNYKFMDGEIKKYNSMGLTSVHAHNKFSDWTRDEFKELLGLKN